MKPESPDITLQINVCAGDLAYCDAIVRALVATHRPDVREVVVIMDCCRPQATPVVHRPSRFPPDTFAARLVQLESICDRWVKSGVVDRVVPLAPDSEKLRRLNFKYSGVATPVSHDHLGHASAAYYQGWDVANTRYVLHFDGDILLHQRPGHSWVRLAIEALQQDPRRLAVSPRIAPPLAVDTRPPLVNFALMPVCGWAPTWPLQSVAGGWTSPWFSTRCHVIDRERLESLLPLTPTQALPAYRRGRVINALLAPLFHSRIWTTPVPARGPANYIMRAIHKIRLKIPAFPLPPEVLVHEHNQRQGTQTFYLDDTHAWFVHPATKPEIFLRLLPDLLAAVSQGRYPSVQAGMCDLDFNEWDRFLSIQSDHGRAL